MQQLDYESMTSYSLQIQAINTAFPRHEAVVNVTVTVRDTNDNTPRFSMPDGYIRSVSESATVGTPVGTVVATDNDGGFNGTVSNIIIFLQSNLSANVSLALQCKTTSLNYIAKVIISEC